MSDVSQYLNELKNQKDILADAISSVGIETDKDETFNSLIAKASEACKRGYSIVVFDTHVRKYSADGWNAVGTNGYNTDWGDVANRKDFKVGDIGILIGHNTTTNSPVMLVGKITEITDYMVWMTSITCIQGLKGDKGAKGDTGPQGPIGPAGPDRLVQYHKYRDTTVNFELKKGHMYSFTVKDESTTSVSIIDVRDNVVTGVAGKKMTGLKNGAVICADRCSGGGLTGKLSLINLNAFVADRWDWNDGSIEQYGPYYLVASDKTGVDIWEF